MMRWGLIPWWAHGVPLKASTINATVERIESAPSYRDPWKRGQRCILVMGGFYEPHVNADGSRDPFFVRLRARRSVRRRGAVGSLAARRRLVRVLLHAHHACPRIRLLAQVHNDKQRMPAILAQADHAAWLTGGAPEALATLKPYPDELMLACKVSRRVNSPKLPNDASLIEPVPAAAFGEQAAHR